MIFRNPSGLSRILRGFFLPNDDIMATVGPDSPVTINYTLSLERVSSSRESLQFRYGDREIFPKLEQALAGLSVGEDKDITLSPNDALEK